MHQLPHLPNRARREVLAEHQHFSPGDRPANRVRPSVHLLRRQEGAAQHFGQPVHEKEPGLRLGLADRAHHRHGEVSAGVRRDPQRAEPLVAKRRDVEQLLPQGRYGRQYRDLLRAQVGDQLRGEGGPFHHEGGAAAGRAQHLAHSVHEAEGKHARDPVRSDDAQVVDHRRRCGQQIGVGDRDSPGEPRGARRVDDLGRIHPDPRQGRETRLRRHLVDRENAAGRLERTGLPREEVFRSNQGRRPRPVQDVLNLSRPQRLVDDHGDPAGSGHAEERRDSVRAAVQEDPDSVVGEQSRVRQRRSDRRGAALEGRIVRDVPIGDHRWPRRIGRGRPPDQTGDIGSRIHSWRLAKSRCRLVSHHLCHMPWRRRWAPGVACAQHVGLRPPNGPARPRGAILAIQPSA